MGWIEGTCRFATDGARNRVVDKLKAHASRANRYFLSFGTSRANVAAWFQSSQRSRRFCFAQVVGLEFQLELSIEIPRTFASAWRPGCIGCSKPRGAAACPATFNPVRLLLPAFPAIAGSMAL